MESSKKDISISIYSIIKSLSSAMDLVSQNVLGFHHLKTSYIAYRLAEELLLEADEILDLIITSLIHDSGVFYLKTDFKELTFDTSENRHAYVGYRIFADTFPIDNVAEIIRYHHHRWVNVDPGNRNMVLASILFTADRIAVLTEEKGDHILQRREEIRDIINKRKGNFFYPRAVEVFNELTYQESFWLDLEHHDVMETKLENRCASCFPEIGLDEFLELSSIYSHIIDFRSSFTATHSSGVAAVAVEIMKLLGSTEYECQLMEIAGYLHDIGKLAIPAHVLEKKDSLTEAEISMIRSHTYYTYRVLSQIKEFDELKRWAAYHHEQLSGEGYPFHLQEEEISREARVMAVADIFTALTEDRPYRGGMDEYQVKEILQEKVQTNALDEKIVELVNKNYKVIDSSRIQAQKKAEKYYDDFKSDIDNVVAETDAVFQYD